jgi:threonyl-tRNA synthetase
MREIVARDEPFLREELSRQEALELFTGLKEDYKVELIREIDGEMFSCTVTAGISWTSAAVRT